MKRRRHDLIKQIIREEIIETQEALAAALCARHVNVTQATTIFSCSSARRRQRRISLHAFKNSCTERRDVWCCTAYGFRILPFWKR